MHAIGINRVGPLANQQGSNRIAGEVCQCTRLRHKSVNTNNHADTVKKLWAVRLQTSCQGGDACTRDTCSSLGCDDHEEQQTNLLFHVHRLIHRVRNEDGRHGEVDSSAVEVEGVSGGNNNADR